MKIWWITVGCAFGFAFAEVAGADEGKAAEAAFVAMLKDATLKGTWAPVRDGTQGTDRPDGYRIVRAEKVEGDRWHLVTPVKRQGQEIEYPIPVVVRFAGDSAVVFLDDARTGDGGTWSARVLFHDDVYAGRWWNPAGKAGTVSGTITRGD